MTGNTDDLSIFSELLRKVDRLADAQIATNEQLEKIESVLVDNGTVMSRMLDRLEAMEHKSQTIALQQERLESYFIDFNKRFDKIESALVRMGDTLAKMIDLNESLVSMNQRVVQLENAKIAKRLARLEQLVLKP